MLLSREELEKVWKARGVKTPCSKCNGLGTVMYSDGSTWRKSGMATQSCERDVCDQCWGTGCLSRVGVNLLEQEQRVNDQIVYYATTYLARTLGVDYKFGDLKAGVSEIAQELRKLSRGRKPRSLGFHNNCRTLADFLDILVMQAQEANRG